MAKKRLALISTLSIVLFFSLILFVIFNSVFAQETENDTNKGYPPEITINSLGYDLDNAPTAMVGKPYKVFSATAKDVFEKEYDVITKVWANYHSSTKSQINLVDNSFTPSFFGEYFVEYVAVSDLGERTVETYSFECVDKESLAIDISNDKDVSGKAGEPIKVGKFELYNVSGVGKCEISAKLKGKDVVYKIGDDFSFCPMYSGEYEIEYSFEDYIEKQVSVYCVTVDVNPNPIMYGEMYVPKYFVCQNAYEFPVWESYHFAYGKKAEIEPEIKVVYEDGSTEILSDTVFLPKKKGDIKLIFTARYGEKTCSKEFFATVVDTGYPYEFKPEKYIVSKDCVIEGEKERVKVLAKTSGDSFSFINSILSEKFNLSFSFNAQTSAFNEFIVWLSDSINPDTKVKISFIKNDNSSSFVKINDGPAQSLSISFLSKESFNLSYENNSISIGNISKLKVDKTVDGENFNGFESGKINLDFSFDKVLGLSSVNIEKINNQVMGLDSNDNAPFVIYNKYSGGAKNIGDLVTLEKVLVSDVLDYNYEVTYYVKDPSGAYVTDVNGVVLNGKGTDYAKSYSFYVHDIGKYNVYISVKDSLGNEEIYAYAISVIDNVAPIIDVDVSDLEGKVGETITLRSFTVKDNIDEDLQVNVFVWKPDGSVLAIKEVNSVREFVPEETGVYKVLYYVMDLDGNTSTVSYKITVKEK